MTRPHLQNPRLWYQAETGDIAFSQTAPNRYAPESRAHSKFLILKHKSIFVALVPLIFITVAVILMTRAQSRIQSAESSTQAS